MPVTRPRRVHALLGRLREPAATSALLVGGLVTAAAVALPAAADTSEDARPAAALTTSSTSTSAPTSTSRTTSSTGSRTTSSSGPKRITCTARPTYVTGTTATTITFHVNDSGKCFSSPWSATIDVYLTEDDAEKRRNRVGSTDASWGKDGTVTGLTPDTEYYWVGSDRGGVQGPVRTVDSGRSSTKPITTYCTLGRVVLGEVGTNWISFDFPDAAGCGYSGFSVDVYANYPDAKARRDIVGSASATGSDSAVVAGLKSGKKYFFVASDRALVQGPVRTLTEETPTPTCTASYAVISSWNGGFVAEVTVTASSAINGWRLSWSTSSGDRVERAWGATVTPGSVFWTSTGSNTTAPGNLLAYSATNLSGAGALGAGQSYQWGVLGSIAAGTTPAEPFVTCIAS